jgi:deoxyadenosine/deoxycytidine kinase
MQKLIIIRGPSGSGKTSVAKELHKRCNRPTLLIGEDQIRFMFNDWKQPEHSACKRLATASILKGLEVGYDVIYEGISNIKTYDEYYQEIIAKHPAENYFFYLDVSFDETIRRHETRPQKSEFGVEEMKRWLEYASPTGYDPETIISEDSSLEETVETIIKVAKLVDPAHTM